MKILYIDISHLSRMTEDKFDHLTKSLCTDYKDFTKVCFGDVVESTRLEQRLAHLRYTHNTSIQHIPTKHGMSDAPVALMAIGISNSINQGQINKALTIVSSNKVWQVLSQVCSDKDVALSLIS